MRILLFLGAWALVLAASGTALAKEPLRDTLAVVKAYFLSAYADRCAWVIRAGESKWTPEPFTFPIVIEGTQSRVLTLYKILCDEGAYNQQHVFLKVTEQGVEPLAFAQPSFDVRHADGDPEGAVEGIDTTGFIATMTLTNAEVDADGGTISMHAFWRGLGDASSTALYVLAGEEFVLKSFDVDGSYDGEINPVRIFGNEL